MNKERLLKTIISSHVSEKATIATEKNNQYVLRIASDATKLDVKDAIEFLFNAKVKNVRIVNVRPKTKMFKGRAGKRKGWKKAYVTLFSNEKLDIVGAQ